MGQARKTNPKALVLNHAADVTKLGIGGSETIFSQATSLGYRARLVLSPENAAASDLEERKPHDVKSALRTLSLACEAIATGYRFDDERAQSKIRAMSKAAKTLEEMSEYILSFYRK